MYCYHLLATTKKMNCYHHVDSFDIKLSKPHCNGHLELVKYKINK